MDTEVCDNIQSLTISNTPESTGVTSFVQEACTSVTAVDLKYSKGLYGVQPALQDIREYFARPVAIKAGTVPLGTRTRFWNSQPRFSSIIASWTTGAARLLGAYGIRATVVYTLQIAATPFHQGLLCLSFQYGADPTFATTGIYFRAVESCTATNVPHVLLDLSNDTMVQLKLPFLHSSEYAHVRAATVQDYAYGSIALNNLVPISAVAGITAPTYQIYVHLEDIELFGSTPQGVDTIVLNTGRKISKKGSPIAEEFENDAHPYSSAAHALGKAIGYVAKGVPDLAFIAGPTAWALDKAAGVARFFGFGKPAVVDPLMRINRVDAVGEWNTDVATASLVLAATANNTTAITTDVGYSNVDEMALSYVTSRWSQINVFSFTTAAAAGTELYVTVVTPMTCWFRAPTALPAFNILPRRYSTATSNSIQPSSLMFAASSFKQWRGTIKYRFTFVKTKMHAGRVMVAFNPELITETNSDMFSAPITAIYPEYGINGPDPFAYSAVFDLKDGNVFEFPVPFISTTPYVNLASNIGGLVMYVVNPLLAPTVVSDTVSVMVEVCGGVDFEVANPVGVLLPVHNTGTIALQAGRLLSEAPDVVNQHTMGEAITSVKQLIAIPHNSFHATRTSTFTQTRIIPPWYYQPTFSNLTPAPEVVGLPYAYSFGGNWSSCYGFLKGGTDVHVYNPNRNNHISIRQLPGNGFHTPTIFTPDNRSFSNTPCSWSIQQALHLRLPAFFPTARVFSWIANVVTTNWDSFAFTTDPIQRTFAGIQAFYQVNVAQNDLLVDDTDVTFYLNRNAADDAQLAMYIGPPPVWLPPEGSDLIAGPIDYDSIPIVGSGQFPPP